MDRQRRALLEGRPHVDNFGECEVITGMLASLAAGKLTKEMRVGSEVLMASMARMSDRQRSIQFAGLTMGLVLSAEPSRQHAIAKISVAVQELLELELEELLRPAKAEDAHV